MSQVDQRRTAAVSKPISGRGCWGAKYGSHDAPGFTLILKGQAWVDFGDPQGSLCLREGDFLLLPTTPEFSLSSEPGVACCDAVPTTDPVRHGEQEGIADFLSIGGSFEFERANAPMLAMILPEPVYIPAESEKSTRFGRLVALLAEECGESAEGKDLIVQRLLEIVLVEAIRWRASTKRLLPAGLGRGLRDPSLSRAITAIHAHVGSHWTVARLAEIAGMSRSAFAAKFQEAVGCGPIEYLARWRMALAKDALLQGRKWLGQIADEIGFESASAFSTAFRRRLGSPPGRFAREQRSIH